jgi:hypothetical protein
MNKEQIIDEAYVNYGQKIISEDLWMLVAIGWPSTKEEFINKCKTDNEFYEKWGLKIEERELSRDERIDLYAKEYTPGIRNKYEKPFDDFIDAKLETRNIPTKLITITYNDKTIESYE